ncbi:MAG: hypothetical protein JSS94_07545 [Bacteroidetes bacterium]|nr:hypothetical protein [Bacteroidota bacterium]
MKTQESDEIETEIIDVIKMICQKQNIDEEVNSDFCPGNFIKSIVLVSVAISTIEAKTGLEIPEDCYIFYDKKSHRQLTIKEATQKLIEKAVQLNGK